MALKLGVVVYSGAGRADEVLTGFQALHPMDREWTDYVGVIERHKTGRISIYGALDQVLRCVPTSAVQHEHNALARPGADRFGEVLEGEREGLRVDLWQDEPLHLAAAGATRQPA